MEKVTQVLKVKSNFCKQKLVFNYSEHFSNVESNTMTCSKPLLTTMPVKWSPNEDKQKEFIPLLKC